MINIENVSKGYGGNILFEGIGFQVNSRERVGLVGRNGHGKTTLFRLLLGEERPDSGSISMPKNYRIGHVQQLIAFTEASVLKEGMRGLPEADRDAAWKVEKILSGLGFSQADMDRHPSEFSGGFQVRLNLAKVLVSEPDLLLLDEPTNYLDITSIRWIERFLCSWPRELMLITHDRGFMDRVVTHTVGIHRKKAKKIAGNTEKYYAQVAMEEEVYEKTRLNDERKRKEVELFITRFRAKARLANMVQSRVKTLAKMEKRDKLERMQDLEFSFRYKPFPAKQILSAENLSFGYGDSAPLFQDLDFTVGAKERVCIVGKNGRGKTTLLKILAGALAPAAGYVRYHPVAEIGYYEQTNIASLDDSKTVEQELLYAHPDVDLQKARNICGAMMFSGDDALKKISVLSGGEKSRVMLGKLLTAPINLLLLDEPTNHLDMDAGDALLAAIDNFDGAVIMVTHNEMFLHALAERLIVFTDEGVEVFDGGYDRFLERGGWGDEGPSRKSDAMENGNAVSQGPRINKKDLRRMRSEVVAQRSRALNPLEKKITRLENDIDAKEKHLARLNDEMVTVSQTKDGAKIARLSQQLHAVQTDIDRLFEKLETATAQRDAQNGIFEAKLVQLGTDG
jgi:ATP-binding cassette subfamily F protein 3